MCKEEAFAASYLKGAERRGANLVLSQRVCQRHRQAMIARAMVTRYDERLFRHDGLRSNKPI